jgi:prolipoprotein diacylglyceryltransferase
MPGGRARPRIARRDVTPFQVCGLVGFVAAAAVALAVSADRSASLVTELALIATAVAVFLSLALVTKAVTGRESLVYYHHEIAVLGVVAAVSAVLGAPILGHLDATALGLGAFLACGRIGCLLAGCCHGRPGSRGICYGESHGAAGFPAYLIGVKLLPVQLLEALAVAALVLVALIAAPATPGAAFGVYVTGYAAVRFGLEELRGDPGRRYWRGLSEAQWTSIAVATTMAVLAAADVVPGWREHVSAAAVLAVAGIAVAWRAPSGLLHRRHIHELAMILPAPPSGEAPIVSTSLGVRVSAGATAEASHYTMTASGRRLAPQEAEELSRVIVWLHAANGRRAKIVPGAATAFHLVIDH